MRWVLIFVGAVFLAGAIGFTLLSWRAEIAPLPATLAATAPPDPERVAAGARLALLGNCAGCHTTAEGAALAGGLAMETPFGTIYSTNITPDPATGIGDWSFAAYDRAMREGVDREGRHLYPAFPYEYFARITESDMADLYAWNMAQPPVAAEATPNNLTFPANFRPLLAGWKLLYHSETRVEMSPEKPQVWNDGAYIAAGLGHCGACHIPRNSLGGAMQSEADRGGEANDWWAPPLTAANPAPHVWTEAALLSYLRTGRSPAHGVAAGPMATVVHDSLAHVPEADTAALAVHYAERMAREPSPRTAQGQGYGIARAALATDRPPMGTAVFADGARLFAGNCASCHHGAAPAGGAAFPRLADGSAVAGPDPRNLIQVMLWGIGPSAGSAQGYMPRFEGELTDLQIAAIAAHLRGGSVDHDMVARLRDGGPVSASGAGPLSGFAAAVPMPADPEDRP
ncbi:cytochrome c [Rhodobacteraceae bacterium 2376]|uniref:Cytochrome c n=1 Tax=Rhabdonatronobacter sediminivivens TaxID=2743469 RepID=A0A7Z0I287_9RHOB|nr:cytochrome c [Rhabdonatronobacter sediminivivens]NYS26237.1 cytochrome c [Rhabdonatronobacter sediminivivens]